MRCVQEPPAGSSSSQGDTTRPPAAGPVPVFVPRDPEVAAGRFVEAPSASLGASSKAAPARLPAAAAAAGQPPEAPAGKGAGKGEGEVWYDVLGQAHVWRTPWKSKMGNMNKLVHLVALRLVGKDEEAMKLLEQYARLPLLQEPLSRLLDEYQRVGMRAFQVLGYTP